MSRAMPPLDPPGALLRLADGWASLLAAPADGPMPAPSASEQLALLLPAYLSRQRWFAAKGKAIDRISVVRRALWQHWLLAQLDIDLRDGPAQTYWLPLALAWTENDEPGDGQTIAASDVVASVRQGERRGVLYDALADPRFCRALLVAMGHGADVDAADGEAGRLEFASTAAFARLAGDDLQQLSVRRASASSSNTTLLIGERLFLKAYRRLSSGINPEVEMGRFLTDASPYAHIAPLAGTLAYRGRDATVTALAMLQTGVESQGDAWSHTLASLAALIDETIEPDRAAVKSRIDARHAAERRHWSTLGRRTGELHHALCRPTGDAAFDPEPISAAMVRQWTRQVSDEAAQTLAQLENHWRDLPAAQQVRAQRLLSARQAVLARIEALPPAHVDAQITRYHGDFHLGQVLVVGDDFVFIDFEGEPSRPLAQRRRKHSPLRDVAGLLRSLNYAANSALGEALAARIAPAQIIEPLLADWEARARSAFLDGYRQAAGDCPAYPKDPQASARLLELFLLEKAFYELRYELAHRPNWVAVPLGGLLKLLLAD